MAQRKKSKTPTKRKMSEMISEMATGFLGVIESMKPDLDSGKSMLLIGDLNHGPDTDEYKLWIDAGWVDTFAKVGKGEGPTFKSDIPEWRIDYVLAAGPIAERASESRPLFEGAFRLNINDEEAFALSDHLPQLAVFEWK